MKLLEQVLDSYINEMVNIDEMQFGFVPGRGTTDAIFIIDQLQEKYIASNKLLNFALVDLEKTFGHVPRKILPWALRGLGVEEWAVHVTQVMYSNELCAISVNDQYNEEFGVGVVGHQGSVLSPLFLILVLEVLSREFHTGVPWELLYADDLVFIAGGGYLQAQGVDSWHGKKRALLQHEEEQVPGFQWWPKCPQEIWQTPLCSLL